MYRLDGHPAKGSDASRNMPTECKALADRLVEEFAQTSDFGRAWTHAAWRLGADPTEGSSPGQRTKMARVPDNAESTGRIQRFEAFSSRSNVLKSRDLTLKCVAAGIR